jgi:hypothetical protein
MINDLMIDDLRRTQEVWVLEILDKGETKTQETFAVTRYKYQGYHY